MKLVARLLAEPSLHFLAIGGLIFLFYAAVTDTREAPADVIVVTPARIEQLAAGFEAVWKRPPAADERDALIESHIREEVYYREALALGLDRDDTVIRRRLRQKMEFLSDGGSDLLNPADGELESYLAANAAAYGEPPRLAFEQVYLGEAPDPKHLADSLSLLRSDTVADFAALSEHTLMPLGLELSPVQTVDGLFGSGFFERVAAQPLGVWAGPVESGYGVHLVRILNSRPGRLPPLAEVRTAVLRDWKAAKALEIRELHYARLRARFVVEIEDAAPTDSEGQ
jgi:hypothetical protein